MNFAKLIFMFTKIRILQPFQSFRYILRFKFPLIKYQNFMLPKPIQTTINPFPYILKQLVRYEIIMRVIPVSVLKDVFEYMTYLTIMIKSKKI